MLARPKPYSLTRLATGDIAIIDAESANHTQANFKLHVVKPLDGLERRMEEKEVQTIRERIGL
jgi:hypothetical protein